ncbi:hypothetical protein GOP47_0007797 [Adiantum capillus-veneris]|uniref:C3H1-type domain-containing protein n=1 Tax=Adiantum capillus-veneris TaxID=13818 RepID=A0A9D4V2B4_ADICA|nr:hypothetical protein GOP47_0007797 [Adiantum capillus-veneris]
MPALLAAASRPMHSYPHFSSTVHQVSHGSSPLSSPTSAISYESSSTSSIAAANDDDRPPDVACALRFGDIPVSSFTSGTHGLMQSPPLLGNVTDMSSKGSSEVKLLNRSQSKLGKRSASPSRSGSGRDFNEILNSEAIPAGPHEMCCSGSSGSCMVSSPGLSEALLAFQKFLPSNNVMDEEEDIEEEEEEEEIWSGADSWPALDVYSCDDFRMYEFKVRKCVRGRSHDWTECPFAHPGEKARRRDPRRYRYSGTACPDFRKGNCRRGEACEYSHGVFECWLHPTRYRTQPCKDGKSCRRRVCFFAHTPEQLRVVPPEGESPPTTPGSGSSSGGSTRSSLLKAAALSGGAYDGSPLRRALAGTLDGSMALELFLDDASSKSSPAAACHHHHHHHWIGMGSSPSSTLVGLSAAATSPSPMSSPVLSPASPLVSCSNSWAGIPGHRRHLDRLRSIPTINIPEAEDSGDHSPPQRSPCTMAELMSTLQSLQLSPSPMAGQSCRALSSSSSGWPLLPVQPPQVPSQSAPNTPKSRYLQVNSMRVDQRAPMGTTVPSPLVPASGNEAPVVDSDVPDLDWVNELVQ